MRKLFPVGIAAALLALLIAACGTDSSNTSSASPPPAGGRETVKLAVPSSLRLLVSTPGLGAVIELSGGSVAEHEKIVLAGLESPQGLAFAKRGDGWGLYAVFVSDDTAGAIYKLVPPG